MKKRIIFGLLLTSCVFFTYSCSSGNENVKPKNISDTHYSLKQLNAKNVIPGEMTTQVTDDGVILTAPGSLTHEGAEYQFGYFGTDVDTELDLVDAPRYKFNDLKENYSVLLPNDFKSYASDVKPYYFLKKSYYIDSYKRENGTTTKLKVTENTNQPFYTDLDTNTLIPEVQSGSYSYFTYYLNKSFEMPVTTFGELDEANKDSDQNPLIHGLFKAETDIDLVNNFDIYRILRYFEAEALEEFHISRDKETILSEMNIDEINDQDVLTTEDYTAYYSKKSNNLYVLVNGKLVYNSDFANTHIMPKDVDFIYAYTHNKHVLFADNFSFASLFKDSKATFIDIEGNSPAGLQSTAHMFSRASNLLTINGLDTIDTSSVTDMKYMFYQTPSLDVCNVSALNTSSVLDMAHMFDTTGLTSIDLSSFDTRYVQDMKYMFNNNKQITNLNVSNLNFIRTIDARNMLSRLGKQGTISLQNNDFSHVLFFDNFLDGTSAATLNLANSSFTPLASMENLLANSTYNKISLANNKYSEISQIYNLLVNTTSVSGLTTFDLSAVDFDINPDVNKFVASLTAKFPTIKSYNLANVKVSKSEADFSSFFEDSDLNLTRNSFYKHYTTSWDARNIKNLSRFFKNVTPFSDHTSTKSIDFGFYNFPVNPIIADELFANAKNVDAIVSYDLSDSGSTIKFASAVDFLKGVTTSTSLQFNVQHLDLTGCDIVLPLLHYSFFATGKMELSAFHSNLNALQNASSTLKHILVKSFADTINLGKPLDFTSAFSNLPNTDSITLNNLATDRSLNFTGTFKGAKWIGIQNWDLTSKAGIVTDSMFEGLDLVTHKIENIHIDKITSAAHMFLNASNAGDSKHNYYFDFKQFSRTDGGQIVLESDTYIDMFTGLNKAKLDSKNFFIKTSTLDLSNFKFLSTTDDYRAASELYTGNFIFKNATVSSYKLFSQALIDLAKKQNTTLQAVNFDNLVFDADTPRAMFNALTEAVSKEKLSLANPSIDPNAENLSFAYIFEGAKYIPAGFFNMDFSNVSDLSYAFSKAAIDEPLHLELKNVNNFSHAFDGSTFTTPISERFVIDMSQSPKIVIDNLFTNVTMNSDLDLSAWKVVNPASAKGVFDGLKFASRDVAVLNISRWQLAGTPKTNLTDFFKKDIAGDAVNIKDIIYQHADVISFNNIKDKMATLSGTHSSRLESLDLQYLWLHATGNTTSGSQYEIFNYFHKISFNLTNMRSTDKNTSLVHFFFITNNNATYDLTNTDFSTWHINVLHLVNFISFLNNKITFPETVDFSNLDVTRVSDFIYVFYGLKTTNLITTNWNMMNTSSVRGMFQNSSFQNWEYEGLLFPNRDLEQYKNINITDCWKGATYTQNTYPRFFPTKDETNPSN